MNTRLFLSILAVAFSPNISLAGLGEDPVVFKSGDWTVRRSVNTMTDKVDCTGLYKDRFDVQLNEDALYISLRGKGGLSSYTLRFDNDPPEKMRLAKDIEKKTSLIELKGHDFERVLKTSRFRAQVLTLVGGLKDFDINTADLSKAHTFIAGPKCRK